ncbi:melanoma antigen preferentially expressed in tumors-like [Rhynchocyon petersi]
MSSSSPHSLFALASQSFLRNQAQAIKSLDSLPPMLLPPLLSEAISSRSIQTVQAMVQAWPFPCLSLGHLMEAQQPDPDIFKAVLDGFGVLLDLEVRPPGCNLKVLDLWTKSPNATGNLHSPTQPWNIGTSIPKSEVDQPRTKRRRLDHASSPQNQHLLDMQLIVELCIKEDDPDQVLTFLSRRLHMGKVLPQICCRKLSFVGKKLKFPVLKRIMDNVHLHCVQEVRISRSLDLLDLAMLAPYLGQMVHVNTFHLSGLLIYPWTVFTEPFTQLFTVFLSQFLRMLHLKHLHLDSVCSLEGHMDQLLKCVATNLETLAITDCSLSESDLISLSLRLGYNRLTSLDLSEVVFIPADLEGLSAVLLRASSTLVHLDLGGCLIRDSQFTAMLPALSLCAQLQSLRLCGNLVSSGVLESLLRAMLPPSKSTLLILPIPVQCYLAFRGPLQQGLLQGYLAELRLLLQDIAMCRWSLEIHSASKYDMMLLQLDV